MYSVTLHLWYHCERVWGLPEYELPLLDVSGGHQALAPPLLLTASQCSPMPPPQRPAHLGLHPEGGAAVLEAVGVVVGVTAVVHQGAVSTHISTGSTNIFWLKEVCSIKSFNPIYMTFENSDYYLLSVYHRYWIKSFGLSYLDKCYVNFVNNSNIKSSEFHTNLNI